MKKDDRVRDTLFVDTRNVDPQLSNGTMVQPHNTDNREWYGPSGNEEYIKNRPRMTWCAAQKWHTLRLVADMQFSVAQQFNRISEFYSVK
jgi:hypothetical protein